MHLPQRASSRTDYVERGDGAGGEDQVFVVVFLRGGADGLTLVPPTGDDAYHRARPVLAVEPRDAIDLDGYLSLNARLRPLKGYHAAGRLALVHGAGTEDTTRSHFEAQDTMEHGGNHGSGWLGRLLRARAGAPSALGSVAIGTTRPESLRGAPGGAVIQTLADFSTGEDDEGLVDDLGRLYAAAGGPLGRAAADTIEAVKRLRAVRAADDPPAAGAVYPDSEFGRGLREIARLVRARVGLVATTIDLGGWDTHFVQANLIGSLMEDLAAGLDAFMTDLQGDRGRVTVVAMTEFGRRLRENTSFGTDHGSGSVMFLLGAGVEAAGLGGKIARGWPDLAPEHLDEVGDVPASLDYRDVLAPLLERHSPGVDLRRVFPGHERRPVWGA